MKNPTVPLVLVPPEFQVPGVGWGGRAGPPIRSSGDSRGNDEKDHLGIGLKEGPPSGAVSRAAAGVPRVRARLEWGPRGGAHWSLWSIPGPREST